MLMHGHDLYGDLDESAPAPSRTITTGTVLSANHVFAFLVSSRPTHSKYTYAICWSNNCYYCCSCQQQKKPGMHCTLHMLTSLEQEFSVFAINLRVDSQPITEYVQHIRSMADKLSTVGAPITNSKIIVKILSGLGPELREISAAIRARDSTITYEELYEKLLDREGRSSNTTNSYDGVRCLLCNKLGHVTSICRSRSHNHFEAKANYVSGMHASANPWSPDSRASHHITDNPHNLQEYNGMDQ
ncbi:PREDICTED: uncharacterized protein LOC109221444, partial [Nicotiana attenuata]|uniref:uncharacterized protein LOC109221444 n=1 Tax=Nicotiana attenuata TaxID=49451 RepID=UPI000905D0F9